ncbi:MAG: glycosyl transferase family 1, partial [Flavobacteriaceae bacterium]|nr:glycosyl transferase family 1 [Flavobacteriaceae bacterium]
MKKVLIITYYWPPAGGPGVQRWLKFVKYLPEFNIEPIVYTPENPSYPILDESLVSEVPENLTILKHAIKEPYRFAGLLSKKDSNRISKGIIYRPKSQSFVEKLLLYIRGNFFIPDARKNWVKPSVKFLSQYISQNKIDTIITTGPPHSLHLIGMQLKQQIGVRWLADFRDPWTTIGYHKQLKLSKRSVAKHKQLEHDVLQNADEIIATSYTTSKEFKNIVNKTIMTITNGFDDSTKLVKKLDERFTCSHIGSLLSERNPKLLWKAFQELINENEDFKNNFQLNLIGVVSDDVLNSIYENDLKSHVNSVGYVSHKEAINYQNRSQVLLLVEVDSE